MAANKSNIMGGILKIREIRFYSDHSVKGEFHEIRREFKEKEICGDL